MAGGAWARVGPAPPRRLHLQTAAALQQHRPCADSHARRAADWGASHDGGVRLDLELQATEQWEGPCSGEGQWDVQVGAGPEGLQAATGGPAQAGAGGLSPITACHQAESAASTGPCQAVCLPVRSPSLAPGREAPSRGAVLSCCLHGRPLASLMGQN